MATRNDARAEGPPGALATPAVARDEPGGRRTPDRRPRLPDDTAAVAPADAARPGPPSADSRTTDVPPVAAVADAPQVSLSPAEHALITLLVELALKPWTPGT